MREREGQLKTQSQAAAAAGDTAKQVSLDTQGINVLAERLGKEAQLAACNAAAAPAGSAKDNTV